MPTASGIGLTWLLEKVVIPAASAAGGGLLVGRQARRSFHLVKLSEAESKAYDAVLSDFKALRMSAAYQLKLYQRGQDWPQIKVAHEEQERQQALSKAARAAYERLEQVVTLGPVELSPGALQVIQSFLAEHENPNRSDGDGIVYEEDYWTKQYLRDFVERRQVDLGAMSGLRWQYGSTLRRVKARLQRWYYARKNERAMKRWLKEKSQRKA